MAVLPDFLQWDLAGSCNCSCRHCVLEAQYPCKSLAPQELVEAVTGAAAWASGIALSCNAEPLLHPRLPDIVRRLKQAAFPRVALTTNGLLLDERLLDLLLAAGLDQLGLSVDALTPVARPLRPVALEHLERCLGLLQSARRAGRFTFSIVSVLYKGNLNSYIETVKRLLDHGIDQLIVNFLEAYRPEMEAETLLPQAAAETERVLGEAAVLARQGGVDLRRPSTTPALGAPCRYLFPAISPAGHVSPCAPYSYARQVYYFGQVIERRRLVLGHLRERPLAGIFQADAYQRFLEQAASPRVVALCGRCPVREGVVCP